MKVQLLLDLYVALVGLVVGSYLNVVIHRLPREESTVLPRSRCPRCGAQLRARDNLPLLSFLLLRGRCRQCKAPISWRYPLVEAATGGALRRLSRGLRPLLARRRRRRVRQRAHRARRHRLRALPAARRHHAAGDRGRAVAVAVRRLDRLAAGAARRRARRRRPLAAGAAVAAAAPRGGDGARRRQDAGDGGRLPRLAGRAGHRLPRLARRRRRRPGADRSRPARPRLAAAFRRLPRRRRAGGALRRPGPRRPLLAAACRCCGPALPAPLASL